LKQNAGITAGLLSLSQHFALNRVMVGYSFREVAFPDELSYVHKENFLRVRFLLMRFPSAFPYEGYKS